MTVFVRAPYNYDTMQASDEAGLKCEDESLAQQHQKEEADINTIVRRFGLTGELPSDLRAPQYGDFTDVKDYQSCLNAVKAADEAFNNMPAVIRMRFGNDPEVFVEFCSDSKNLPEMVKLGLAIENPDNSIVAKNEKAKPVAQIPQEVPVKTEA